MTTTATKGRITGALALTLATDQALAVGDFVHLIDNYKCALADGTKPLVGTVTVRSVKRVNTATSSSYPVPTTTGGQVTVDVRGTSVLTRNCGAALQAGQLVGIGASSTIVAYTEGSTTVARLGIALTTTTAAGQEMDILAF